MMEGKEPQSHSPCLTEGNGAEWLSYVYDFYHLNIHEELKGQIASWAFLNVLSFSFACHPQVSVQSALMCECHWAAYPPLRLRYQGPATCVWMVYRCKKTELRGKAGKEVLDTNTSGWTEDILSVVVNGSLVEELKVFKRQTDIR